MRRWIAAALLALMFAGGSVAARAADSPEAKLIQDAFLTLEAVRDGHASGFKRLWQRTKAVLIVPNLVRGAWIVGGEFGSGVLLVRRPEAGGWSDPVFYTVASGSVGFQFGAEVAQVMLVVAADQALEKILSGQVRLGVDAGFAAGPVGRGAQMGTTLDSDEADIFALRMARGGLFGGIAMKGGLLLPNDVANANYYGEALSPADIAAAPPGSAAETVRLRSALNEFLDGLAPAPIQPAEVTGETPLRRERDGLSFAPGARALTLEELADTRRTRPENPPLSRREGRIVDAIRANETP